MIEISKDDLTQQINILVILLCTPMEELPELLGNETIIVSIYKALTLMCVFTTA